MFDTLYGKLIFSWPNSIFSSSQLNMLSTCCVPIAILTKTNSDFSYLRALNQENSKMGSTQELQMLLAKREARIRELEIGKFSCLFTIFSIIFLLNRISNFIFQKTWS